MAAGAPPPRDLSPVARAAGVFAIALGLLILLGWVLDLWLFTQVAPSLPAAMPNSALMFVAAGVALIAESSDGTSRRRWTALACGAFVAALAGATLIEHATGSSLGVDNPLGLATGDSDPGRPATHTAGAFLLLGCCLLAAPWRSRAADLVAGVLSTGAAAVVGLAVAGYLIGVGYLYGTATEHGTSAHTALGLVVVLVGVFALRPHEPPAAWYAYSGGGEAAARRLMGPALVLPFLAGGLVQMGATAGWYGQRFGLSIMVVVVAALIQALIYRAVKTVRTHEAIESALERESRANVERFAALTRQAPVGIFETDLHGKAIFVNERWTEITGLTEDELRSGRSPLHPDDAEWVRAQWRAAAAERRDWDAEFRYRRPDGGVRWVACHASAVRDGEGKVTGFLGSALDITGRRAAEERTGQVVSRIAEAVSVVGPDGRHLHVNDAARAMLDKLSARFEQGTLAELSWRAITAEGEQLDNSELPAEVTRTTGRAVDEQVVGFPSTAGGIRWLRISTRTLSDDGPPYTVVASFSDVTAQRESATRLDEARKRFELAFDHAPIGVCLVSLGGRLLRVNQALCEMFGYSPEELLATTFQELTDPDDIDTDLDELRRMLAGEINSYEMEKRYTHKDGSQVWALVSVSLVRGEDEQPQYFIAQILDVTERRRLERSLRQLADHDSLTGLANRRVFSEELGRQLARERRYGGESSLLMIDLDGFKEVNDSFGHAAGDRVLHAVADTLAERVRDTDLAARLGGDEFAILLPSTPRAGAEILAIDVVQAVRELRVDAGHGKEARVTASVGIACSAELPEDCDEDSMLAAADLAMYRAKRTGRDRYAVHGSAD